MGDNAVQVTGRTATWNGIRQSMLGLMQPGATYICGAWVRTSSGTPGPVRMSFELDYAVAETDYEPAASAQVGTEWTYIASAFTLQPVEELTQLYLYFDGPEVGVEMFIDEVEVRPVGAGATGNVLINPDFEFGLSGWSPRGGGIH